MITHSDFFSAVSNKIPTRDFTDLATDSPTRDFSPPANEDKDQVTLSNPFLWNYLVNAFTGEKYPGGLGNFDSITDIDYNTLRRFSYNLFTKNRYAKGLVQRLVTNVIHRGLGLESDPNAKILGLDDDFLNAWTDDVETKFELWGSSKEAVSWNAQSDFPSIQEDVYRTALLSGDVLVVLRQHEKTKLPVIQLLDGSYLHTPLDASKKEKNNEIRRGVEIDSNGRHIAFYIKDFKDKSGQKSIRILAKGKNTGRRIAWLVYSSKIRLDDVRGIPLLAIIIQAIRELDRYSDAEQRAAVLNAILAFSIERDSDGMKSAGFNRYAAKKDNIDINQGETTEPKQAQINQYLPGVILENLEKGEKLASFSAARPNVNYRAFEEAMMASFAWVSEMPPNIFRLAFSSNYSASTGEVNEFKLFLDKERSRLATGFHKMFYPEWLLDMVLNDQIIAPGFLEAWRSDNFFEYQAWIVSQWFGAIKPSMRFNQDIKGYRDAVEAAFITRGYATRALFGVRPETVWRRLEKENAQYVKAMQPLIDAGLIKTENNQAETETNDGSVNNKSTTNTASLLNVN